MDVQTAAAALLEAVPSWAWLSLVFLLCVAWWMARTRTRRRNMARGAHARRAEAGAERLLARAGYRVVERQVTGRFQIEVDGTQVEVSCRADLVVQRRRRRYIAEVKTGHAGTDPTHPGTRRQLLEYRLAFDVHGVLLVDMEAQRVRSVDFPALRGGR